MGDIDEKNASGSTKLVGADSNGNETNYINATTDGEVRSSDSITKAIDGTLNFTAGTPTEIKVGGSRMVGRKTLFFIPSASGKYGTSAVSQNIPAYKNQPITLSVTDDQGIWFDFNSGTNDLYVFEGSGEN